jgi:hypothetical protein
VEGEELAGGEGEGLPGRPGSNPDIAFRTGFGGSCHCTSATRVPLLSPTAAPGEGLSGATRSRCAGGRGPVIMVFSGLEPQEGPWPSAS